MCKIVNFEKTAFLVKLTAQKCIVFINIKAYNSNEEASELKNSFCIWLIWAFSSTILEKKINLFLYQIPWFLISTFALKHITYLNNKPHNVKNIAYHNSRKVYT